MSLSEKYNLGHDEASQLIKELAADNEIRIALTDEQYRAILSQWDERDPRRAARIVFHVEKRDVAALDVAGYRYRGDTCCV